MKRVIIKRTDLLKVHQNQPTTQAGSNAVDLFIKHKAMENGIQINHPFETEITDDGDYLITQGELEVIENYLAE